VIVIVDEQMFLKPPSPLGLLAVFQLCFEERHILLTDPIFTAGATPTIDAWLAACPEPLRIEATLVLEQGPVAAAQQTNRTSRLLLKDVADSYYRQAIPVLKLEDALFVLQSPLRLLVENGRNDGAFLQKVVSPLWRDRLLNALARRWAEFENGGGIGELTTLILRASKDPRRWMRLWVMFDSDARAKGQPSAQSQRAVRACAATTHPWAVQPQQLERRAIENYLPLPALFAWAELASGPERVRLRRVADAFSQLQPEERAHYNMKEGLLGDVPTKERREWYVETKTLIVDVAEVAPLFRHLTDEQRRALHRGFGSDVGTLFANESGVQISEDSIRAEIPHPDRDTLFQSIFDRI
jgi:hypothetical protein